MIDRDNGAKDLIARLRKMSEPATLTVGVHASANGQGRNGVPVVEYASYNEFGTSRMPSRSFLRAWADANVEANKAAMQKIALDAIAGKRPYEQGLARFGTACVGAIQARIAGGIEHAPWTYRTAHVYDEGHTPLIDTGTLRSSITFEVNR